MIASKALRAEWPTDIAHATDMAVGAWTCGRGRGSSRRTFWIFRTKEGYYTVERGTFGWLQVGTYSTLSAAKLAAERDA